MPPLISPLARPPWATSPRLPPSPHPRHQPNQTSQIRLLVLRCTFCCSHTALWCPPHLPPCPPSMGHLPMPPPQPPPSSPAKSDQLLGFQAQKREPVHFCCSHTGSLVPAPHLPPCPPSMGHLPTPPPIPPPSSPAKSDQLF